MRGKIKHLLVNRAAYTELFLLQNQGTNLMDNFSVVFQISCDNVEALGQAHFDELLRQLGGSVIALVVAVRKFETRKLEQVGQKAGGRPLHQTEPTVGVGDDDDE